MNLTVLEHIALLKELSLAADRNEWDGSLASAEVVLASRWKYVDVPACVETVVTAIGRAMARFGKSDALVSTTRPSNDDDMMLACDIARFVEGNPVKGTERPTWRWTLTERGRTFLRRQGGS